MTPIKLSELEKEIEYQDEIGTGMDCRDSYCMEIKPPDLSRLCEALRIAHVALENISSRNIHLKVKLSDITEELYIDRDSRILEAANAKYKINSLVDLS